MVIASGDVIPQMELHHLCMIRSKKRCILYQKGDVIPQMEIHPSCMIRSKKGCIVYQKGGCNSTDGITSFMYDIYEGCNSSCGITSLVLTQHISF